MGKIVYEVAEAEITKWLDKKKVLPKTRDKHKEHIETLTNAIEEGHLSFDEDSGEFIHKLLFSLGEGAISELRYKCRINHNSMKPNLKGIDPTNVDDRLLALIATLTTQPRGIISALDSVDNDIARSIAIFFI